MMNTEKLRELPNKNETAKRVLDFVAQRQRNTVYTAFNGLKTMIKERDNKEIDADEFNKTFAELEKIGAGKINRSVRGKFKGFYWDVPIKAIAQAIKEKQTEPQPSQSSIKLIVLRNKKSEVMEIDEAMLDRIKAILNQ